MPYTNTVRRQGKTRVRGLFAWFFLAAVSLALLAFSGGVDAKAASRGRQTPQPAWSPEQAAKSMVRYFERMSEPKPFVVRTGKEWEAHRDAIRRRILKDINLDPLPERIPLDPHYSEPIEHPWCVIHKVAFQLWPGVYSRGLLFMPRELREKPAPAVLCVHGHTDDGYADADEQRRYLTFAKLGYVTFVTPQDHHEDILRGYSHQTYMVWNNMRGLDFLQSLPEVDPDRIGVNGLSGGGLQSQMLVALDSRLKAATIGGMTCDYREELFPYRYHCECNHWPEAMTYTDQPEISTLGFPTPIQFLTMDDWTAHFAADNFPTIQMIYRDNGFADRAECLYWPTEHMYDRVKRERTYWWAEKWVRGNRKAAIPSEPENVPILSPAKVLLGLEVDVPRERTYEAYIQSSFRREDRLGAGVDGWKEYRMRMKEALLELVGDAEVLAAEGDPVSSELRPAWAGRLNVEEILVPSEGGIVIPSVVIHPEPGMTPRAVEIYLSTAGRAAAAKNPAPYLARVRQGAVVVLPDVRFSGDYAVERLAGRIRPELVKFKQAYPLRMPNDHAEEIRNLAGAWNRNGIIWGRPVPGMMVSDLRCVVDFLQRLPGLQDAEFRVETRDTSALALAALFAACLDPRIKSVDADFRDHRFAQTVLWADDLTALPIVSRVLCFGDIPQWASLLADRALTLRNVPTTAAERSRLEAIFARLGNRKGLKIKD